jgi:ubiquinone/menaquinone biosynthesis C-methylase UbiE
MRKTIEIFEEEAVSYDEWYCKPIGLYALRSELKGLDAMLPLSGLGLDVGAGTGIFAKYISTEARSIICLDPSPEMLKKTRKRNLPSIIAVVEALPVRKKSLKFAYMVTVLEFLSNPLVALSSIGEMLVESAPLVILMINRESSWGEFYSKLAAKGHRIFSNAKLYTFSEVSLLLKKAGFKLLESLGTLTTPPNGPPGDYKLVPIGRGEGIIVIKAIRRI